MFIVFVSGCRIFADFNTEMILLVFIHIGFCKKFRTKFLLKIRISFQSVCSRKTNRAFVMLPHFAISSWKRGFLFWSQRKLLYMSICFFFSAPIRPI